MLYVRSIKLSQICWLLFVASIFVLISPQNSMAGREYTLELDPWIFTWDMPGSYNSSWQGPTYSLEYVANMNGTTQANDYYQYPIGIGIYSFSPSFFEAVSPLSFLSALSPGYYSPAASLASAVQYPRVAVTQPVTWPVSQSDVSLTLDVPPAYAGLYQHLPVTTSSILMLGPSLPLLSTSGVFPSDASMLAALQYLLTLPHPYYLQGFYDPSRLIGKDFKPSDIYPDPDA